MGIANELSSDVAAAVLARRPGETKELVEIVRDFHSTMRDLVGEERRRRLSQLPPTDSSPQANGQAASGSH